MKAKMDFFTKPWRHKDLNQVKEINVRTKYPEVAFLFQMEESRATRRQITYYIEKACAKIGMPVKSAHDIRRTVASVLFSNGVPLNEIRRFLGHKDEKQHMDIFTILIKVKKQKS